MPTLQEAIVVLDDDIVFAEVIKNLLERYGFTVHSFTSARRALAWLDSHPGQPLAFLVDLLMPEADGLEFIRALADRRFRSPVLVISGADPFYLSLAERYTTGFGLQFVESLPKPLNQTRLVELVTALKLPAGPDARRSVLVVDDDPVSRLIAAELFIQVGFTVLQAGDGTEALAMLKESGPIDLLFADIGMPGMDGPQLAAAAVHVQPGIEIILTSAASPAEPTDLSFVQKPLRPAHVLEFVRTLAGQATAP